MKNLSRKEATKVLEGMKVKIEIPKAAVTQWKRNTALDMGIEALKYSEIPNSSDTISRTDAIDAVAYAQDGKDAQRILEQLPSAQPESCAGCKSELDGAYGECNYCKRNFTDMYEKGEQDE